MIQAKVSTYRIGNIESRRTFRRFILEKYIAETVIVIAQIAFSIGVPIALFLTYQGYALRMGITLAKGCEGPETAFGMLPGLIMAILLRFNKHRSS